MKEQMPTANKEWQPVLTGADAETVLAVVGDIAKALHNPPATWIPMETTAVEPYRISRGASLAVGSAGLALFFAYLSQIPGVSRTFAEEAEHFISHALDALEAVSMTGGLFRGLSGIAWTVQHLQGFLFEDESADPETDPNADIDQILLDHWSKPEKFDLWGGCAGLGVYALERYPRPGSKLLLEILIQRLDELSSKTGVGIAWFTPPKMMRPKTRMSFPDGYYDLGVAHGAAGIISFLSRVYALGISKELTGKLLDGAVSWMLAQQMKSEAGPGPLFPEYVLPTDVIRRLTGGWCHGDIGMAAALLSAAQCTGETSWAAKAVETAHAAVDYYNPNWQPDTTLCHGTAGLGHLFNRIYQATGENRFREEARKWFGRTLELRQPGTGIAGFFRHSPNEEGEIAEQFDPGFIQGAAGIGLALLSGATAVEPRWDRVMLLSST